jgi:hypothetical protein
VLFYKTMIAGIGCALPGQGGYSIKAKKGAIVNGYQGSGELCRQPPGQDFAADAVRGMMI